MTARTKKRETEGETPEVARRAVEALEAAEDIGEFDLEGTIETLGRVIDPKVAAREAIVLVKELLSILRGTSDVAPDKRDWRFKDAAWSENPFYKRLGQSYLATYKSLNNLIQEDAHWRDRERAKFVVEVLCSTLAPTNTLLGNPAALKKAFETGGKSLVRGAKNFIHDRRHNGGMPRMVDATAFKLGENMAATPGSVVFRNEVLELLQYTPTTSQVASTPVLLIPAQINKYYFTDLAPGRSLVEYAVSRGIQMFVVSWRNPTEAQADWDLDTYISALLEATDAVCAITRSKKLNTIGFCAGGITMSVLLAYMAANGDERVNAISYAVTLLDWDIEAQVGMLHSERLVSLAKSRTRKKGIIAGKDLGNLFAWFRPNELIWNYWVNNYLMGLDPPSFDILAWNDDSTNLSAGLHVQYLDLFLHNSLTKADSLKVLGTPIDLGRIKSDAFVTGAITDHLTPWQGCYQTTQLMGGKSTFVLSNAGHIASLVNPPGNPKASYSIGPASSPDAQVWREKADKRQGSWWEAWADWVTERGGGEKNAPKKLGNRRYPPLENAPGTYILE